MKMRLDTVKDGWQIKLYTPKIEFCNFKNLSEKSASYIYVKIEHFLEEKFDHERICVELINTNGEIEEQHKTMGYYNFYSEGLDKFIEQEQE